MTETNNQRPELKLKRSHDRSSPLMAPYRLSYLQGRSQEFELPWAMSKINELQKKNSEYEYAKVT